MKREHCAPTRRRNNRVVDAVRIGVARRIGDRITMGEQRGQIARVELQTHGQRVVGTRIEQTRERAGDSAGFVRSRVRRRLVAIRQITSRNAHAIFVRRRGDRRSVTVHCRHVVQNIHRDCGARTQSTGIRHRHADD